MSDKSLARFSLQQLGHVHLVVFVVLKHADTVFDDEEEVDAGQRC